MFQRVSLLPMLLPHGPMMGSPNRQYTWVSHQQAAPATIGCAAGRQLANHDPCFDTVCMP